jgi:hypothetical protein
MRKTDEKLDKGCVEGFKMNRDLTQTFIKAYDITLKGKQLEKLLKKMLRAYRTAKKIAVAAPNFYSKKGVIGLTSNEMAAIGFGNWSSPTFIKFFLSEGAEK